MAAIQDDALRAAAAGASGCAATCLGDFDGLRGSVTRTLGRRRLVTLPGVERASVDAAKVRDYLLSNSHPVGRFKAAFFAALGYEAAEWERLASDLRSHARHGEAVASGPDVYGQKYEVRGTIEGPNGREAVLVAVWIVLRGENSPRFVTAYPGARA